MPSLATFFYANGASETFPALPLPSSQLRIVTTQKIVNLSMFFGQNIAEP